MKKQFIIIIIVLTSLVISSCDIIDQMFERGSESVNDYKNISKIEVEYFIDNATYTDGVGGAENGGEFTSIAGTSTLDNNIYHTIFNNPPVLGKRIRGEMKIAFNGEGGNRTVNVIIDQDIDWNWDESEQDYWSGQLFEIKRNDIPFNKSYVDDFDEKDVDEYYLGGSALTGINIRYNHHGIWGSDAYHWLIDFSCGERAFIKVKVYFN